MAFFSWFISETAFDFSFKRSWDGDRGGPRLSKQTICEHAVFCFFQTPHHFCFVTRFPHREICLRGWRKSILNFQNVRKSAKTAEISQVDARQLHQNAAAGCEPAALD